MTNIFVAFSLQLSDGLKFILVIKHCSGKWIQIFSSHLFNLQGFVKWKLFFVPSIFFILYLLYLFIKKNVQISELDTHSNALKTVVAISPSNFIKLEKVNDQFYVSQEYCRLYLFVSTLNKTKCVICALLGCPHSPTNFFNYFISEYQVHLL